MINMEGEIVDVTTCKRCRMHLLQIINVSFMQINEYHQYSVVTKMVICFLIDSAVPVILSSMQLVFSYSTRINVLTCRGSELTVEIFTFSCCIMQMCILMKKKHTEAKELAVRAIVNNNMLLMLNHPMFEEKISFPTSN